MQLTETETRQTLAENIESYLNRPQTQEKAFFGRILFSPQFPKTKELTKQVLPATAYLRVLDDAVDTSPHVQPIRQILYEEVCSLQEGNPTPLQEMTLRPVRKEQTPQAWEVIKDYIVTNLTGFQLESAARQNQQPIEGLALMRRNYKVLWPCIACINIALFNSIPSDHLNGLKLINFWGQYDNLGDLAEDLNHGILFIPKGEIKKHQIDLIPGNPLPYPELVNYYNSRRTQVAKGLLSEAKSIFSCRLHPALALLAFGYFIDRCRNLRNPLVTPPNLTYCPPLDASPSRIFE